MADMKTRSRGSIRVAERIPPLLLVGGACISEICLMVVLNRVEFGIMLPNTIWSADPETLKDLKITLQHTGAYRFPEMVASP